MGTSLLSLPVVQDALGFALAKIQAWQDVPARVRRAQQAVRALAVGADPQLVARLTLYQQSLDGITQQYLDSAAYTSTVLQAAQAAQAGRAVDAGVAADAARLAGTIASGLGALQQVEQALVEDGATLPVGDGGAVVPKWAKWGLIGVGLWWVYRHVLT